MKLRIFTMIAALSVTAGTAFGQTDTTNDIEHREIKILSARVPLTSSQTPQQVTVITHDEIAELPVHTIDDVLKFAAGVDVRQRGNGVQTDISVRGGSFDQVTILLNGINITSPHTGHLSADFPLSPDDIERVEILEGPSARVFGTSSFTGTVNIVTREDDPTRPGFSAAASGMAHVYAGDHGNAGANANATIAHNAGSQARMTHTLSAGHVRDDGDTPNSAFESTKAYYKASYKADNVKANFQAGYSYRPYEANTFYGSASTDQWESNEHFIIAAAAEITAANVHIAPSFAADRRYDHYQWHRDNPAGENFHRCDVRTAGITAWASNRLGRTSFTAEMRNELIYSTKLGEPMLESEWFDTKGHDGTSSTKYNHSADRTNILITAEHDIILPKWTIAMAVPAITNTDLDHKWRFCPGTDVTFRPGLHWKLFANVNSALRMPTFTDLYYSGTNIEGTSDLSPERTVDFSIGTKARDTGFTGEIQLYASNKKDMIDWVIYGDQGDGKTYKSGNFKMHNRGAMVMAGWLPSETWENCPLETLKVQYAYNDADIEYSRPVISSKYAMEYLRHKVVASAVFRIVNSLVMTLDYRYNYRVGEGNDPYALVDYGIKYDIKNLTFYADATNIFDKDYRDFSYIEQSGFRMVIGAKIRF